MAQSNKGDGMMYKDISQKMSDGPSDSSQLEDRNTSNDRQNASASVSRRPSDIQVMVIAETQQQRLAFGDTVANLGFKMLDCIAPHEIKDKHFEEAIDVWLVDSQFDDTLYQKLSQHKVISKQHKEDNNALLVGFNKAPYLNETHLYAKWQRKLRRKLANMLDMPQLVVNNIYKDTATPWQFVVFLGASMGGPSAVKEFLDNLPTDLPITILLAHHFNGSMIHTLPRILNRHNSWKCQVISTTQPMQSGYCLIAPIAQKVVCDSTGRVILTNEAWEGEYKPCIGDMLKNASDAFGNELISIIFSGMGQDGVQHLDAIADNQSLIWVQDPKSSACESQPQAMIDTGKVDFIGTPEALADKLIEYVESKMQSENNE